MNGINFTIKYTKNVTIECPDHKRALTREKRKIENISE